MSYGCVLAGGQSTRMGKDKVLLRVGGRALVEHAVARLQAAGCTPVIAAAGRPELRQYAPVVEDVAAGRGPLGGIEAALRHFSAAGAGGVLCLAVDLPLVPAAILRLVSERAQRTGALVTVPFVGGAPQPLCAVYHTGLHAGVLAALERGDGKIMRVMRELASGPAACDFFRVETLAALQPTTGAQRWFTNLNTPDDLARLGYSGVA